MTSGPLARLLGSPGRAALLAAALAFTVHLGALANGFANDDEIVVAADPALRSPATLLPRLAEPYWPGSYGADVGSWRPLTTAVFGVAWWAGGGAPWPFHLAGILLHAAASALVVLVLASLLAPATAGLAGLLFAVHPVHVEAVANVVGLAEPLSACLALAAVGLHARGGERDGPGRAAAVALLYLLAVLAKEGAVVLPGLVLLVDAARRELGLRDLGGYLRRRAWTWAGLVAALAAGLLLRTAVLGGVTGATYPPGMAVLEEVPRIWTLATVWPHWVRLLVFPVDLAADYGPGILTVAYGWTPAGVLGVALALGALAGAWVAWRRGALLGRGRDSARAYGLAVVWVGLAVLPVANVFFSAPVLLAERTLYLASVGAVAGLATALAAAADRAPRLASVAAVALLAVFAVRSVDRVPAWRDSEAVMATLLEEHPESGWAWWSWSRQLAAEGRVPEARRALAAAVQLLNSEPQVGLDVGSHLLATGHPDQARLFLERAWRERPGWYSAAALLASLELRQGRPEEAFRLARAAAELAPDNPSAHHLVAESLAAAGRWNEAVRARRRSLEHGFADRWRAWATLAGELGAVGDTAAARAAVDSARLRAVTPDARARLDSLARALTPNPLD